jgi:hypothetical protein
MYAHTLIQLALLPLSALGVSAQGNSSYTIREVGARNTVVRLVCNRLGERGNQLT